MERLVPPHAPVGLLNGSVLPIRWEFPGYTSFQSWRPQKRLPFIFLLKSISNLEKGRVQTSFCLEAFSLSGRKQNLFRGVLWWWWRFFRPTEDYYFEAEKHKQASLRADWQPPLPCLTALFRGLCKLPSSLFFYANCGISPLAHQRIILKMQKEDWRRLVEVETVSEDKNTATAK